MQEVEDKEQPKECGIRSQERRLKKKKKHIEGLRVLNLPEGWGMMKDYRLLLRSFAMNQREIRDEDRVKGEFVFLNMGDTRTYL